MNAATKRREFEREVTPHIPSLRGLALRLADGRQARADDVLQEALLSAYRAWHTFRPGTNRRAWLMKILRNAAVNQWRTERRHADAVPLSGAVERRVFERVRHVDPEGRFFARLLDSEIVQAIESLPLDFREPLILSDLEGLSYGEVADLLEIPLGTVKSRLFRARRTLQARLYEYAVEAGYLPREAGRRRAAG